MVFHSFSQFLLGTWHESRVNHSTAAGSTGFQSGAFKYFMLHIVTHSADESARIASVTVAWLLLSSLDELLEGAINW